MPPGQEGDQSQARAINYIALPHVVGWNESEQIALIWKRLTSTECNWSVIDFNTVIRPCGNEFAIRQAHDVNDSGWVVAVVNRPLNADPPNLRIVLLTPYQACLTNCDADLVGPSGGPPDCNVSTPDFLEQLNSWGPCPSVPAPCRADLDCDGTVGTTDQLELLGAWGSCPGCTPCSSSAAGAFAGPSSAGGLQTALALMGFQGVAGYQQWLLQASDQEAFESGQILGGLLMLLGG